MNRIGRWTALLALLIAALAGAPASAQSIEAADKAIDYIKTQQQADGSFAGFGPSSTADAVIALAGSGQNVADIRSGGKSAIDYMISQAPQQQGDVGVSAKFLIAMLLAGQPASGQGYDLPAAVQAGYDAASGRYGADVTSHCYALIALVAAGKPVPPEAYEALRRLQLPDGGWSFDGTAATGSDTNTTSLAVQALAATAAGGDPAIAKAVAYFKAQQNDDAGWPYAKGGQGGGASDTNSTALAIQGLYAANEDLDAYSKNGTSPLDRLLAFQNASGAFRYQDGQNEDNAFATYQAVPAMLGGTLPDAAVVPAGTASAPGTLPATGVASRLSLLAAMSIILLLGGAALRPSPQTRAEETKPLPRLKS